MIDTSKIQEILKWGESETLEIKSSLKDSKVLAKHISAFANKNGGSILIGIEKDGEVVGVERKSIERIFSEAAKKMNPQPQSFLQFFKYRNKDLADIKITKSDNPIISEDGFYIRSNAEIKPISQDQISFGVFHLTKNPELEMLYKSIAKQTEIIENLRKELNDGNSFKTKMKDYIIGGIIGAVIGMLFTLL